MMSCDQAHEALEALVFAELDDDRHAQLNEHIGSCEACRHVERELLELRAGVRGVAAAPRPELAARIRAALAREAPVRAPFWRRPVPAWTAVAAVVGCSAIAAVAPPLPPALHRAPSATFADTSGGVPMAAGDVTFSLAEPFDTRVRAVAESAARGDTARDRMRRDTL